MKRVLILLIIFGITLFTACSFEKTGGEDQITVAVSVPPLQTIVKAISKDHVRIVTMIPPGNSPANYAPSPKILKQIEEASIYFSLGVPAEEANIKQKAAQLNEQLKIINLNEHTNEIYPDLMIDGSRDPHIWLSLKRVKIMVDIIAEQLSLQDEENRDEYYQNANAFKKSMDETDQIIRNKFKNLKNKEFMIYHPAMGYYADEYGLSMIAVEFSGKNASIDELRQVIDYAKSKGIKTVFYQAEFDKKQAKIIADEIGGVIKEINPLSADYLNNLVDLADALVGQ